MIVRTLKEVVPRLEIKPKGEEGGKFVLGSLHRKTLMQPLKDKMLAKVLVKYLHRKTLMQPLKD